MKNIDQFNAFTARLLGSLYETFPQRLDVDFCDWLGKDVFEVTEDELEFCSATLEWLVETGYVTARAFHTGGTTGLILTAKGLEMLKAVPESLKAKESIGEAIAKTVKGGAMATAKKLVSRAFTESFKLLGS